MLNKLLLTLTSTLIFVNVSVADPLPNRQFTYGSALLDTSKESICVVGYTKKVRKVSFSKKKRVFSLYKEVNSNKDSYEVDHLIPLGLGGSNEVSNLWPQSYTTYPWNAHTKDALENKLRNLVCQNKLDIHQAQYEISTDWIKTYKKYIGSLPK